MERKKYYVNIGEGEISQMKFHNNAEYTIYATSDEVRLLRAKFDNMHNASVDSYWRSHVPIVPYHNDSANDKYDENLINVFQMLYDLGDDTAKKHIDEIGILPR